MYRYERDSVMKKCISKYGTKNQMDMCIEEMSELTKAILKYRRKTKEIFGGDSMEVKEEISKEKIDEYNYARQAIIDELADVEIMCRQMEIMLVARDEVDSRIDFKLMRQLKRLEGKDDEDKQSVL